MPVAMPLAVHRACVGHIRCDKGDHAAAHDRNLSLIDDACVLISGLRELSGQNVGIRAVGRCRDQRTDVDLRAFAEKHAIAVDQHHTAIGIERAENLGDIYAADTVHRDGLRIRLHELRRLACADIEARPVDDDVFRFLVDVRLVRRC